MHEISDAVGYYRRVKMGQSNWQWKGEDQTAEKEVKNPETMMHFKQNRT